MTVCLFKLIITLNKQTYSDFGHQAKNLTTARIRIGKILTPLHKQEMDFQNLSLTYAQETEQINGVKCKRSRYYFLSCVKHLGPE